jgi:ubiquinone biosynthesis protein Coq4
MEPRPTKLSKWNTLRIALAAYRVYHDPDRLDEVLDAGARLAAENETEVARLAEQFGRQSEAAAQAIRERTLTTYDLEELARCPAGSLGRAVYEHCAKYGIHPSTFPKRPTRTPGEFILAHLENTHDVWHPVCGFGSDAIGELGLQCFYLAQFPNLLGLLLLAIALLRAFTTEPESYPRLLDEISRGWLLGKRALPLFGVRWDRMWDRPLAEIRAELHIDIDGADAATAPSFADFAQTWTVNGAAGASSSSR